MATLKDDNSSWKAHGLKKKRRDWDNDPKPRNVKNKKKSTAKWCKGRVGVEHDIQKELIVQLNPLCAKNGTRDSNGHRIFCGHWRHHVIRCVKCHKEFYQSDKTAEQKKLEEKWCREGHMYDWVESTFRWGSGREIQTCLMCGKTKGKSRKKMDDA